MISSRITWVAACRAVLHDLVRDMLRALLRNLCRPRFAAPVAVAVAVAVTTLLLNDSLVQAAEDATAFDRPRLRWSPVSLLVQTKSQDLLEKAGEATREVLPEKAVEIIEEEARALESAYKDFQLFFGFAFANTAIRLGNKVLSGPVFFDCPSIPLGDPCGHSGPVDVVYESGEQPDYSVNYKISLQSPFDFFGNSNFGYGFRYEAETVDMNVTSGLGSGEDPAIEVFPRQVAEGELSGELVSVTPWLFYAFINEPRQALLLGFGYGLGYLDIKGFFLNGTTSKGILDIVQNDPIIVDFQVKGLVVTNRIIFEYLLGNFRVGLSLDQAEPLTAEDPNDRVEFMEWARVELSVGYVHYL